jgi:hypothetical protein
MSITVSDLPKAMRFLAPLLGFLGYTVGRIFHDVESFPDPPPGCEGTAAKLTCR